MKKALESYRYLAWLTAEDKASRGHPYDGWVQTARLEYSFGVNSATISKLVKLNRLEQKKDSWGLQVREL
jgi:hypothetical protein